MKYTTRLIGEVSDIRRGASPRPIDEWMAETGIPWVKISDATQSDSRFIYKTEGFIREDGKNKSVEVFPEDLIISNSATPGLPRIMKIHACIHDGWLLASNFRGVTRDYLLYQVKYLRKYLVNQGSGSIFTNLKTDILKEFPIQIPVDDNGELDEEAQSRIAKILTNIEDKIENNVSVRSDLKAISRLLYNYWFVQFDFPDKNGRPYKASGGEMVYNDTLKREIPKGWKVCSILDVVDWIGGAQPPKSTFIYEEKDGYVRFIQNRDYADDNNKTWIPESKSNKICSRFDIMMDKYGDAGRIRFGLAGAYNVALAKIDVKNPKMREYIRGFLDSDATYRYLYNACMASTRASLNEEILGNLDIVIPDDYILERYQGVMEKYIQMVLDLNDEDKELSSLRDWLLPMLMNGQVKIAD